MVISIKLLLSGVGRQVPTFRTDIFASNLKKKITFKLLASRLFQNIDTYLTN